MPVSRKRKSTSNRRRKRLQAIEPAFDATDTSTIRIKPHIFDKLRQDDDFIALIRVARLTNVLNYTMDRIVELGDVVEKPTQYRTFWRNLYNAGGYVHEGLLLVEALRDDGHGNWAYFSGFKKILDHKKYLHQREITRVIRNSAAFHLDHHDRTTRKALKSLNLPYYDFVSGEDDSLGALYFNIADVVDVNYLVDEFKGDRTDETEVLDEIRTTVTDLLGELARASERLVRGIARKMKLTS